MLRQPADLRFHSRYSRPQIVNYFGYVYDPAPHNFVILRFHTPINAGDGTQLCRYHEARHLWREGRPPIRKPLRRRLGVLVAESEHEHTNNRPDRVDVYRAGKQYDGAPLRCVGLAASGSIRWNGNNSRAGGRLAGACGSG